MAEEEKNKPEKHSDRGGPPAPFAWVAVPREDWGSEDNALLDLGLALIRYRFLAISVFVLVVVLGLLFALLRSPKYEFITALRIGQVPVNLEGNDTQRPIDSSETILATIQSSLLPRLRSELEDSGGFPTGPVQAELPPGSSLLSLRLQATEDQGAACRRLLERLGEELVADHRVQADRIRTQLESLLEREKILLEELQDPLILAVDQNELKRQIKETEAELSKRRTEAAVAKSQLERLGEQRSLLQSQIEELEEAIRLARENRSQAAREAADGGQAMTLMLIDNELRQNQLLLNELNNQLEIGLKDQRDQLQKTLDDVLQEEEAQRARLTELQSKLKKVDLDRERRTAEQKQKIIEMESQLGSLSETVVALPPTRSVRPVGVSRLILITLSAVLGLALGLSVALGAGFMERLRHYRTEQ